MRILTLVRHAKSSWDDTSLQDFDRPLNARGKRDAPLMGEKLAEQLAPVELMISSPAARAIATARILAGPLDYPPADIRIEGSLYDASRQTLLTCVSELDNRYGHVVVVAHNPGLEQLGNFLGADIAHMPTCGALTLEFPLDDWRGLNPDGAVRVSFQYPGNLR